MANLPTLNAATLSTYSSLDPKVVATLWDKAMQDGVIEQEWLSKFQGAEGSDKPIIEKTALEKGGANTVNFTVESELVGDGVQGGTELTGVEEVLNRYTYSVQIDYRRHAVAVQKRLQDFTAAQRKLALTRLVSKWMARKKQIDGLMSLVKAGAYSVSGKANNLLWAGGASSDAGLTPNTGLDTSLFQAFRQKMIGLGAKPANISKEEGYDVPKFVMWATTNALSNLKNDSAWNQANLMARGRENGKDANNPLFTGAFSGKEYDGIVPYEFMLPDHDNPKNGAIGSPLEPRALLRTATVSTSDTTTLTGGGSGATSSGVLFFRDFPGYDYLFVEGQTAAPDSGTYYAKIKDAPGSANAGEFEVISYTGSNNNGNTITSVTRNLAASTNTSGVHAAGSVIVPCNIAGVEYGYVICAGANALLRAYGSTRERLTNDAQDYGFSNGVGVEAVFGQTPAKRTDGLYPNFVIAKVALI